ncbi:MAG: LPD38 domain-containing protein [Ruminococcus bromii]|nr:LPD38 domain-containing protein [Ruminococcus bromii]
MAKNKKIPELSLQNTFKTAEKTLKMNTPSKKEKEEVDKKFGEKKSAGGAASLKKGPVTERRAAEIISENYAPPSPMPSQNRGRTGADVLKRAGEVWREEKRTVSPYSGMSYREMTDDINNTYGGELRRGNIGQLDFYLERGKYDRERIEKAGREELSELLSEKENEYNILFEMPRYSGGNYDVIDSRAKEVKALYDEIRSRINAYDTNEKIKKDYEREFYKYGKEALNGDSEYKPTESGMTDYDLINNLNKREDGKRNPLGHLTEGELKIYNSLYNESPQNPEKAEAFLKSIEGTLNKRLSDYETQEAYKYAKEHPYIAGAKSVAENVLGGTVAAIDNIAEGITGDVDTYDYTSRVAREGQALRQGGSQYMKENHGKGAEFAYGAGLSMVENLANIALFKGLGKVAGVGKAASGLPVFNMASGAAANSMINIADRGGSDIQILTGGVASGVAEYLFEKISFDKLFDIKSTKGILNMIKADAIQVGVEGSEEIFTEAANIISDALIMQGNSENNIRRRQYVMQGMSAEEATKKVFFETVDQIASAGAAGMLSGGIMGGGAIALNNISHNNYVNNMGEAIVNNKPALERLIQLGLDEGSADARFAAELISQGESISGKEAGALLETIIGESISKNGGIANIIKNIYTLQGGDARYITSKKAIDTAMAVQHMAEGKVTDVDRALLQKSPGAVSLLSIVEGNEAAWKSLSGSATQTQNTKGKMQSEIIDERGTPYTQKELVDEDVYSNGQKVVIPENGRVAKNIVLNDESLRVRREKAKDYKNVETLAEDLEMKVMYVKGLTDSNGEAIGGIVTSKGIIINSDAENISRFVATHEFSHRLKQISPERWNSYQSYVIDKLKTDGRYYDVYERKSAAYRSREDAIIDEEIASDYIGELFENETELAEFIRKDVKEASKVRNLWYNILDKLGLLDEKKKAQRLWASAYREGMSNKGKEFEGRKLSIQLTPENLNSGKINKDVLSLYEKDVDAVLNGTYTGDDVLVMGGTPKIYTDIGLSKLPITIKKAHVYSIAKTEAEAKAEGRYKKRENYHGLGANAVKNILYEISKPIAVIAHPDFAKYNANPNNKRDSTHKVIAIVELKVNGKNVIAPIEIDADLKYKNSQIDANNIATYFDKNNVENILGEALALESQNLTGFYFADKKRTEALLKTSGYQLPSWLRTHGSNTIIRSITENVNRKIDTALKSKQFIKWFGDWQNKPEDSSKAVNPDGTPMVLYHQTAEEIDIFDTRHEGAGTRDDETPFGIFLKPTPKDIGLKGKHQMALYANIRNPLEVANRNELVSALKRMSFEFSELYEDHKRIDKEYKSKSDKAAEEFKEYIIKWRVANPEASRQAIYEDEGFNQVYDAEEQIIEEWQEKAKQLELKTKEIITKTLEDNGYDGVHLLEDAGSFGRNVETWIALKPEQVKSATDNIGTYDGNNPNNKKSISGTRLSDIENERTAQLEAEYTDFLRRNGGGIQTFRPEKEKGWLSQQWITQRSKDNKEMAKSLNEISDIISKDFKIPVTNRKFDDENVAGTFNYSSEVIHSRAKNDIVTIAHEVGHLLDKKLKLQKLDGIETLVSNFDKTLSALGYEEGSKKAESVGEFIRMYLTNEDIAKTFCPEYYDSFKQVLLNSEYSKALEKLSKAVNAYLSSTTSERINLAITNDIDERTDLERVKDIVRLKPLKTLVAKKEKFPELWRAFNQELIDSFYAIGEAQGRVYAKNPEGKYDAHLLATNSLNAAARSAYILTNEFVNMDGERVGESFIDCLTPIFHKNRVLRAKNISTLNRYLVLKHALEWIDPKQSIKRKKVFVDETLENPDILREEIAQIEKQNPQIKEAAEKIYQYLKNLKKYWGVDTGLITKELSTYLDEIYPCYVPFFRETKNKGIRGARVNLANQRAPILEATGGSGMIVNPLESIIRITEKYVKTSSRNMAMQAIAHMADNVEGSGFIIERADGSSQKALEGENILGFNKNNLASATPEELKNINTEEESWKKEYGNGQGYVSVLINGKKIWYQINDEKLFKAVADMEPKRLNAFLRGCNVMLNLKRALITSNNPLFATTNAVRDAITAYNNIDINNPFEYIGAYFKAFAHVIKKDPNYKRWCAMGGGHSSELSANMNSVSRALKKAFTTSVGGKVLNSIVHPIELIASINDIVESTPRLMAFEHEMKKSGNVHKAINKADDITTNFKRGGRTAKALNNVFMFSNAAIQGLDRTIRSFTKKDTEHSRRNRIIKYAITSVFSAVVQQIINRRDDETEEDFKNLSKYMRRSNFVVGIGDGRFLRIPTAREQDLLRVLISDAINSAFEGKEALDGLIGFVIDTLWPWYVEIPTEVKGETATDILTNMFINTARNTPFGTLTDFASNKDFTGSPIIPKMYENEIAENQYNEKTSKLAVFLGKTFKESPLKIEYLINNNLGILGTVNKSLFPVGKSQKDLTFGFKTRWIADSYYSTDVLNKVYAKRDAAKEALKRFNDGKALAEYEKANAAATFITQYNKIINVLPDNEKRNARGRLNAVINSWGNGNGIVTNELIKIYDSTGENLFMKLSKNEITTFNGKRSMTEEEYSNYALNHTAAFETALSEVVLSPEYSKMSDNEKIKALEKASKYASDYAKAEAIPDYELTKDEIDALKDDTKFMEDVLQSANEKRVENIGAELYEKYASSMENTENYKSEIEKLSQNGDSKEDIQKAVNSFGKKEGSYKKEKQKIYKEVKVDTSGLPKNEAEEVEKIIYQYAEDTAATQYIPGYTKTEYVKVYDTRLSSEMSIEEFAKHRAYAKKTAAMADGKEYMKKKELEAYLDSTNYSRAVKGALFDAIGNKGWKNKYTGKKVGEWQY